MMKRVIFSMCVIWLGLSSSAGDLKLWYSRPAGNWTEALPVGNSRLGAMVYGGTGREGVAKDIRYIGFRNMIY